MSNLATFPNPGRASTHATINIHNLRFADSVSLSLEYQADKAKTLRLMEKAS